MKKWMTIAVIVLMLTLALSMGVSAETTALDSVHLTDQELSKLNSDLIANELEPVGEHRVMKIFMGYAFEYAFLDNKNLDEVLLETVPLYAIEGEGGYRYYYYYYDKDDRENRLLTTRLPNHANNEMAFFFDYALCPEETFSSTEATANLKDLVFYEIYCMDGYEDFFGALLIYYKTNQGDFVAYSEGRSVYPKDKPFFEYLMPLDDFRQALQLADQEKMYSLNGYHVLGAHFLTMSLIINLMDLQSYVIGNAELPELWYQNYRTPEEVAAWEEERKNNTENNTENNTTNVPDPAPVEDGNTAPADDGCASIVPGGVGGLLLCATTAVIISKKRRTRK